MEDCGDRIELARRTAPGLFSFDYVLPGEDVFKDFQFHHHDYVLTGENFLRIFLRIFNVITMTMSCLVGIFLRIFYFTTMTMSCLVRIFLRIFNVLPGEDLWIQSIMLLRIFTTMGGLATKNWGSRF